MIGSLRRLLLVVAAGLALGVAAAPAGAQEAGGGDVGADTTSTREFISTDGSVSVFEEAVPGEGIDGFWWEFNKASELARLLDKDRREDLLEPLVDPFGFELALPESIVALRDSVAAVADSILALRIDTQVRFDPKFKSSYNESKDVFVFENNFDSAIPMTDRGSVIVAVKNRQDFNESTKKLTDNRSLSSTFNYTFREGLVSTFTVNRTDDLQERDGVRDTDSANSSINGTVRATQSLDWLGQLDASVGLSTNRRKYENQSTDGINSQVSPNWSVKVNRPHDFGSVTVDYKGDYGLAHREENVRKPQPGEFDANGDPLVLIEFDEADEKNFKNTASLAADYKLSAVTEVRVNGSFSRDRFQYLSQVDSLRGQQESRRRASQSAKLTFNTKPFETLDIKSWAEVRQSETDYDLETARFTRTLTQVADAEIAYDSWEGGGFVVKMRSSVDDRDYRSNQAGKVYAQKASLDFDQTITPNIDFSAAYFLTLDAFEFDDPVSNSGDRDLRSQRGLFVVRYSPPVNGLSTSLNVEVKQDETINLHPTRAGDNRTDQIFVITPEYSWKVGAASISGNFKADARYKLYDFRGEDDELIRRFSLGQRWQHAFTERTSTDVLWNWEFTDQGRYPEGEETGKRAFVRTSELRRLKLEVKLLYSPFKGLKTNFAYRRDADDRYSVRGDERSLTGKPRTTEFTWGIDSKKKFTERVTLDVKFSQTHKRGSLAVSGEDRFYNIRATLNYQPFKAPEKRE